MRTLGEESRIMHRVLSRAAITWKGALTDDELDVLHGWLRHWPYPEDDKRLVFRPGDEMHIDLHDLFHVEDVDAAMQIMLKAFREQHPGVNRGRLTAEPVPRGVVLRLYPAEDVDGGGEP